MESALGWLFYAVLMGLFCWRMFTKMGFKESALIALILLGTLPLTAWLTWLIVAASEWEIEKENKRLKEQIKSLKK